MSQYDMFDFVGSLATVGEVKEHALRGRALPVVRCYRAEAKFLLNATLPGAAPWEVRYIKVPSCKIKAFSEDPCALHSRAVIVPPNRDTAFADAGFDVEEVWALDVRHHESVRPSFAFDDVPKLQARLNMSHTHGSPFQLVVGYFIFADLPGKEIKIGTQCHACYSSEPIVLLKDCRGQLIDVSVDLEVANGSTSFAPRKIFIEDPMLTWEMLRAGMLALAHANEMGFLGALPLVEHWLQEKGDDPVTLGMLPSHIGEARETLGGTLVHIFKDAGLRGHEKTKKSLRDYSYLANLRRHVQKRGGVICSREFFVGLCKETSPTSGTLISADMFGNVCFACYTRLTEQESKMCGGCGKARYCSAMCQNWHWNDHRHKCASPEERKARREAAALAKEKRAAELAKHDQRVALERAEEASREAVRKHQAMVARAERAEKGVRENARLQEDRPTAPSDTGQSRGTRTHKKKVSIEEQLVHAMWSSEPEREVRREDFNLRQEATHLEAEARKAQERVDKMKAVISEELKKHAAAAHSVPSRASVGEALEEAVEAVEAVRCVAVK